MKTKGRKSYVVRFERDEDGWWVATVKGYAAQTQGRTIEQSRERVREAIGGLLDVDQSSFDIADDVRLSRPERRALDTAKKAAKRAAGEAERAERATRDAARALCASGLSLRDAGTLLGVSRQRIHQILGPKRSTRATARGRAA